ncbi:MAG: hypothetical protein ABJP70_10715 [Erythrobacter sp.]
MSDSKRFDPDDKPVTLLANRPFVVGLLYLGTAVSGFSGLVGLVLAYVFRSHDHEEWEASHYRYLIRTFWLVSIPLFLSFGLLVLSFDTRQNYGTIILFVLIGGIAFIFGLVRTVLSIMKSHVRQSIPNPGSWTF